MWSGAQSVLSESEIRLVSEYLSHPELLCAVGSFLVFLSLISFSVTYWNDATFIESKRVALEKQKESEFDFLEKQLQAAQTHKRRISAPELPQTVRRHSTEKGPPIMEYEKRSRGLTQCNSCYLDGAPCCSCRLKKRLTSTIRHLILPFKEMRMMTCILYLLCLSSLSFGITHLVRLEAIQLRHVEEDTLDGTGELLDTIRWSSVIERLGILWYVLSIIGFVSIQIQFVYPFKMDYYRERIKRAWFACLAFLSCLQLSLDCAFQLSNPRKTTPQSWIACTSAFYSLLFFAYISVAFFLFPKLKSMLKAGDAWKRDQGQRLCVASLSLAFLNIYLVLVVLGFLGDIFGWFVWILSAHLAGSLAIHAFLQWLYYGRKSAEHARRILKNKETTAARSAMGAALKYHGHSRDKSFSAPPYVRRRIPIQIQNSSTFNYRMDEQVAYAFSREEEEHYIYTPYQKQTISMI